MRCMVSMDGNEDAFWAPHLLFVAVFVGGSCARAISLLDLVDGVNSERVYLGFTHDA